MEAAEEYVVEELVDEVHPDIAMPYVVAAGHSKASEVVRIYTWCPGHYHTRLCPRNIQVPKPEVSSKLLGRPRSDLTLPMSLPSELTAR